MAEVTWSDAELDALRRAFASGTLCVSYEGKTVEYGSADDLLKRIRTLEREMAAAAASPLPVTSAAIPAADVLHLYEKQRAQVRAAP